MKKGLIYIGVVMLAVSAFSSCEEIGPTINLRGNANIVSDTSYIEVPIAGPEAKNVVIEEFTGVRCPNCPQGHVIINTLKTQNPGRIVSISLHPINSLGAKYHFSAYDFVSQQAQSLFDFFGQIGLQPAAGIDRKQYPGETAILLDKSKWQSYANQQIGTATPVNVLLDKTYDTTTRELTVITELHYTQTVNQQNRLTVLLTESALVSAQLDGSVIDTFYVHNDVMRTFITATSGDAITDSLQAGRVVRKVYKKILDAAWVANNMHIVAFVHEFQNSKNVYQGKEIKAVD